jgi:hypothetical protein
MDVTEFCWTCVFLRDRRSGHRHSSWPRRPLSPQQQLCSDSRWSFQLLIASAAGSVESPHGLWFRDPAVLGSFRFGQHLGGCIPPYPLNSPGFSVPRFSPLGFSQWISELRSNRGQSCASHFISMICDICCALRPCRRLMMSAAFPICNLRIRNIFDMMSNICLDRT